MIEDEKVLFKGVRRRILTYKAAAGSPIILMLHAFSTPVDQMAKLVDTTWLVLQGFHVVLPQATLLNGEPRWDDNPLPGYSRGIPDVGFLVYTLDRAKKNLGSQITYLSGFSNGAFMANRFLHEVQNHGIRAQVQVAGALLTTYTKEARWKVEPAVPTIMINGTKDPRVHYEGSLGVQSALKSATYYAGINGAGETPTSTVGLLDKAADGTTTSVVTWSKDKHPVTELFTVNEGGHTWPGSPFNPASLGKASQDFKASQVAVDYFRAFP